MRPPPVPPEWASSLFSVGVTGTNGKTSTTASIASLLGELGRPVARVTTVGSFLDDEQQQVPAHYPGFLATMERCRDAGGRFAAIELTSEALALGFAKAWPWRVGVFTNLSHDHSDVHGSVEHYLACKAQLFMALPAGGVAVLNARDPHAELIAEVCPRGVEIIHYGVPSRGSAWAQAELSATRVSVSLRGTRVELEGSRRFPGLPPELTIRAVGEIFAENALAALATALAAGVSTEAALGALGRVAPPPGRFEVVRERPWVIVDYAHTPDALARTLTTARQVCRGEVTIVFGAGGGRDREKRPLLGAAARGADRIVLTSDNPRGEEPLAIMAEVAAGIGAHPRLLQERDRARAIRLAIAGAAPDDLVLITGKGHEQTQERDGVLTPFSDVAVVRESPKM